MMLYTDIPSRPEIDALWQYGGGPAVSIYLETAPESSGQAERIAYKNAVRQALSPWESSPKSDLAGLADELAILDDEGSDEFWQHQARTLAAFATPTSLRTFRLPNRLPSIAVGGSRFLVKPLLRAVTFPQAAFVLALAQGSVRLLEAVSDGPAREIRVPDLPTDVASAAGKSSIKDRAPVGRIQGSEGQKVRMAQFARLIDSALRGVLPGQGTPLVLVATEPLDSIFRAHCSYPYLVPNGVPGSPEGRDDGAMVAAARDVLDGWYAERVEADRQTFADRSQEGRASSDVAALARFATQGAVDTLFLDIDANVPGTVDDSGAVSFAATDSAHAGDLLDEVARRAWFSGARVLAVRKEDMPAGAEIAGTLRYAPVA